MSTEVHDLIEGPITCHCWNRDRTKLALSPNNNLVHIYANQGGRWQLESVLKEHDHRIMGMDWAPTSNRLVTCGADRNAYVWTHDGKEWKPSLVVLRINRAATCVKWSPLENKFAVGSGARSISICHFEQEHDWWVSKHIKKPIRSTVLTLDWHPNNVLLACGCADFKARVFSAYIKDVDEKPESTCWGKKMTLGTLMMEFASPAVGSGGWVHGVSFSPSGNKLAWVSHDSIVCVVNQETNNVSFEKTKELPFLSCQFTSETNLIVAGHGCFPAMFKHDNDKVAFSNKLERAGEKKDSGGLKAMDKFKRLDKQATTSTETKLETTHQNGITQISIFKKGANVEKIATTGVDGKMVIWKV